MQIGYSALILLLEQGQATTEDISVSIVNALQSCEPTALEIETIPNFNSQMFKAFWDGWNITLHYNAEPYVIEESQEIARKYAQNRPDRAKISECSRRIELRSEADPEMMHFNNYIILLNQLEARLSGSVLFDATQQQFI